MALAACSGPGESDLVRSAQELLAKNDPKGAVIQLKSALQQNADSREARLLLGKALLEMGDAAGALVELQKAQELQAPDEEVVPLLANALLLIGDPGRLIAQYGDLKLKGPRAEANLRTAVATAYATTSDFPKARTAADAALMAMADHPKR
ncbi:MAG: tetratricopeptide repeat protein [Comamonadaceae bacterium]|nr:tetratricopeptide repeat protein [Comamonadaceae bacterium]